MDEEPPAAGTGAAGGASGAGCAEGSPGPREGQARAVSSFLFFCTAEVLLRRRRRGEPLLHLLSGKGRRWAEAPGGPREGVRPGTYFADKPPPLGALVSLRLVGGEAAFPRRAFAALLESTAAVFALRCTALQLAELGEEGKGSRSSSAQRLVNLRNSLPQGQRRPPNLGAFQRGVDEFLGGGRGEGDGWLQAGWLCSA